MMKITKVIKTHPTIEKNEDRSLFLSGEGQLAFTGHRIDRILPSQKRGEDAIVCMLCQFGYGENIRFGWIEKDAIDYGLGVKANV
jgi:hypothetical protein